MRLDFSRFVITLLLACPAAAAAQEALTIRNGERVVAITRAELAGLPAAALTPDDKDGGRYEGVAVMDLLARAGVTFGQTMRGPRLATYLVAAGGDGYRVVIALPEIDPDFTRHPGALVAWRRNGEPLPAREGPLQLILPADRRHARWVRNLVSLTLFTAPEVR